MNYYLSNNIRRLKNYYHEYVLAEKKNVFKGLVGNVKLLELVGRIKKQGRGKKYDCILGLYAMKAKYIKLYNHTYIDNYKSAEIALARYIRFSGANIKEMNHLDLECCFAEDKRILNV